MSDICTVRKSTLDGIAEAIQSKTGESGRMLPSEMAGKIEALPSQPAKGLVFSEYDSDGYPHKAEFVGSWTEIPSKFYYQKKASDANSHQFNMNITRFDIPDGVQVVREYAFAANGNIDFSFPNNDVEIKNFGFYTTGIRSAIEFKKNVTFSGIGHFHTCGLTSVTFGGEVNAIPNECFKQNGSATVEMYDFSHCSAIPPLYSSASLNCKSGCVIKVPSALLTDWQNATNWSALTNVTWQGV